MLARRRGGRIPVAVTFDDDLASHSRWRRRCSERLACPAAFFLTGAGLDGPHCFWWQRLQAAADRGLDPRPTLRMAGLWPRRAAARRPRRGRRAVADGPRRRGAGALATHRRGPGRVQPDAVAGPAAGAGGLRDRVPHPRSPAAARARGRRARARPARRTGRARGGHGAPATTIAYPHGRADERVAAAARAAGYTDGFGGPGRSITARSDRLLLGRTELLLEDPSSFELAMALRAMARSIASPARNHRNRTGLGARRRPTACSADPPRAAASDRLR